MKPGHIEFWLERQLEGDEPSWALTEKLMPLFARIFEEGYTAGWCDLELVQTGRLADATPGNPYGEPTNYAKEGSG